MLNTSAYLDGYMHKTAQEQLPNTAPTKKPDLAPITPAPKAENPFMERLRAAGKQVKSSVVSVAQYIADRNPEFVQNQAKTWANKNPEAAQNLVFDYLSNDTNRQKLMTDPRAQAMLKQETMKSPLVQAGGAALVASGGMNIYQMMKNKQLRQQMAAMQARQTGQTQPGVPQQPYSYRYR